MKSNIRMSRDLKLNNTMTSEMKFGLNLVKGAITILSTDTASQVISKNSIGEIDSLLKIGDEKLIDKCNGELSVKYRSIFGVPGGRFLLCMQKSMRSYHLRRNGSY